MTTMMMTSQQQQPAYHNNVSYNTTQTQPTDAVVVAALSHGIHGHVGALHRQ